MHHWDTQLICAAISFAVSGRVSRKSVFSLHVFQKQSIHRVREATGNRQQFLRYCLRMPSVLLMLLLVQRVGGAYRSRYRDSLAAVTVASVLHLMARSPSCDTDSMQQQEP